MAKPSPTTGSAPSSSKPSPTAEQPPAAASSSSHKKKKPSAAAKAPPSTYVSQVDFSTMENKVLRRYKRAFKVKTKKDSREELVAAITKHWASQEVSEKDTLSYFIYNLRNMDKVFKLPPKPSPPA